MGLDVSLYLKNKDTESIREKQKMAEEKSEEIWEQELALLGKKSHRELSYNDLDKSEEEAISNKIKDMLISLGLFDYSWRSKSEINDATEIEIDSKIYPDHVFKIGYLRSSYNGGGINYVLDDKLGKGYNLYDIFKPEEVYRFVPKWKECLQRAKISLGRFDEVRKSTRQMDYSVVTESFMSSSDKIIKSEKEAMKIFLGKAAEHKSGTGLEDSDCSVKVYPYILNTKERKQTSDVLSRFLHILSLEQDTNGFCIDGDYVFAKGGKKVYAMLTGVKIIRGDVNPAVYLVVEVPKSATGAVRINKEQLIHGGFSAFSFYHGYVNYEGVNAEGVFGSNQYGIAANLIYKRDGDSYDWYRQALEIVVEMCEWVLSKENPNDYELSWSS